MNPKNVKDPVCGMEVSPHTSLKLRWGEEIFYFCNPLCLKKFASQYGIASEEVDRVLTISKMRWYKNKVFLASAVLTTLCLLSLVVPSLVPFRITLLGYLKTILWAMLLGLIFGGVIEHFIPREYISQILGKPHRRTIAYSVFLGFLMSVCSHGILALSIELHRKGASTPAVVAFLLSSPWANLPFTLLFISFFGMIKALYIIVVAIIIALITGFIYQILESRNLIEKNQNTVVVEKDFSLINDLRTRFGQYGFSLQQIQNDVRGIWQGTLTLADMVLWWTLIGVGLASLAGAYVPQHIFQQYMGPTVVGMLVTLGVATILEVCSEAMSPMAFEIYRQTGALGNSFVFLMAGVVTDYTEIGLLWHNVGRKVAVWLPVVAVPQVILFGILANIIF